MKISAEKAGRPLAVRQKTRSREGREDLSVQEVLQLLAAGGVAELAQGLGLDLADALTGDVKFLAHFLQGTGAAVLNAEAELQHLLLSGRRC